MKNTLILTAEQMISNYATNTMSFLKDYLKDVSLEDFSNALTTHSKNLAGMLSRDNSVALSAMRNELWAGGTMMMLSDEEFNQIEKWYEAKEEFQVAIFRADGTPFGLLRLEDLSW